MKLVFTGFRGTAPKFDDQQLLDGYAVRSVNTRTGRQILEPWREPVALDSVHHTDPASIFKYNTRWFSWPETAWAIRAPLKNDPFDYCIITQDGVAPKLTDNLIAESGTGPYPAATYDLGVPIPTAPTILSVTDNTDFTLPDPAPQEDEYDEQSVAYAICYEDALGRLSALSPASNRETIREYELENTNSVLLQLPSVPVGLMLTNTERGSSAKVRIFRTNFSGNGAVFQFVAEVPYTESQYSDTTYSGDLLESPINENWTPPPNMDTSLFPNGPMRKVVVVGDDIIAGHNDKLVCFAEPDAFYAYPTEYFKVFQESIVTIIPTGSSLAVLTDGHPYIIQGAHPASMDVTRLADPIPCVSEQGVTEVFGLIFFVGSTGLWSIDGYSPSNITRQYYTDKEWSALSPDTMKLANYDGRVFIYCETPDIVLMYDPTQPDDGIREITMSPSAFAVMESTRDLAYVPKGTSDLVYFDSSPDRYMPMDYISKTYHFNSPINFSVMKVKANAYPVTVTIEKDNLRDSGKQTYTASVNSEQFVYMPFQNLGHNWRIRVHLNSATDIVQIRDVQLAQSPSEFD